MNYVIEKKKLLLDTDIGDDIDDCLALTMILNLEKQIELVGVTTVFRDTEKRARIAKKMLSLKNVNVPVYAGKRNNFAKTADVNEYCSQYSEDLSSPECAPLNDPDKDDGEAAVDFIISSEKKYGADLTIVAIGPLTNIGRAIEKDRETMKNARIVLMGGQFFGAFNEWNILCDPEAAKIVIESGFNVECLGLDVTQSLQLRRLEFEKLLTFAPDDFYEFVRSRVKKYADYTGVTPVLHDPLAVYYAVTGKNVLMREQLVRVETKGEYTRGQTVNIDEIFSYEHEPRPGKRIKVGCAVNSRDFVRLFMGVYTGEIKEI